MGTFHDEANLKFRPQETERMNNEYWIERVQAGTYDGVKKKMEYANSQEKIDKIREHYEEKQGNFVNSVGNSEEEIPLEDKVEDDKSVEKEEFEYKKQQEIGQSVLKGNKDKPAIHLLNIIGEVEGHIGLPQQTKATKYEHVIPELAAIENNDEIKGVLVLLNTVGGDVEAGLAISELIASISKPTVSLVLGGSHSIGVPLAVAANYSYIVPSATMIIHPVRMNGTVIGIPQTFEYFERMQERILDFIVRNSNIEKNRLKTLMLDTGKLAKDVGSILVGIEAVHEGIINEIGGIKEAFDKLYELIEKRSNNNENDSKTDNNIGQTFGKVNHKSNKLSDIDISVYDRNDELSTLEEEI